MHAVLLPATRHFFKLLNNKGSMFSWPRHGVHWKRHVHRCLMTRSPPLYALPTRSYAPPKSGSSFCRTLYNRQRLWWCKVHLSCWTQSLLADFRNITVKFKISEQKGFLQELLMVHRMWRNVYNLCLFHWWSFPNVQRVLYVYILLLRCSYFYSNDFKQHEQSLLKQLLNAEGLSQSWIDIVVPLAKQIVDTVWPDTKNDDMDIRQWVVCTNVIELILRRLRVF